MARQCLKYEKGKRQRKNFLTAKYRGYVSVMDILRFAVTKVIPEFSIASSVRLKKNRKGIEKYIKNYSINQNKISN